MSVARPGQRRALRFEETSSPPLELLSSHGGLATFELGASESLDDVIGAVAGDLHEAEAVGDLDRPDLTTVEPGLTRDRSDEVLRANVRGAAEADEDPRRLPSAVAPRTTSGVVFPVAAQSQLRDVRLGVLVAADGRRLVGELDRGECDVQRVKLVGECVEHDAEGLEIG